MSLLPTWPIAVGALVLGMAGGAWIDHTVMAGRIAKAEAAHADVLRQIAQVQAQDEKESRDKEQAWAKRVGQVEQENKDENARIADRYAAQLDSLRKRADRRPAHTGGVPEATDTCQGATGAELSRSDAGFLAGLAARADQHRAALDACYRAYDAVSQ